MTSVISSGDMRHASTIRREAMMAWCRANNINPDTVNAGHPVIVRDEQIHWHEQQHNSDGRTFIDPCTGQIATTPRRVPLIEPMPDEWPGCPSCGS